MIKTKLLLLLLLVPSILSAQIRLPPESDCGCPAWDSITCTVAPQICAQCWAWCHEREPQRRIKPSGAPFDPYLMSYGLPRTIGAFQVEYDAHFTTYELFNELALNGFTAATIWHTGIPFDGMGEFYWTTEYGEVVGPMGSDVHVVEDMYKVWTHPAIKTIFYRPQNPSWTFYASDCPGFENHPVLTNPPYYDIAKKLYEEFWWLDKTVVLVDWEQDSLFRGDPCWATGTLEQRIDWWKILTNYRQLGVERARREEYYLLGHRPKLRVMTSVVINRWPGWHDEEGDIPYLAEIIPTLLHPPDLIGVSYWQRGKDPTIMLDWLRETTGYPAYRIFLNEFGETTNRQVNRFADYIPLFWEYGIRTVNIWLWKETHCRNNPVLNRGLWVLDEPCSEPVTWDRPTDGYYVIMDLLGGNDE